MNRSKYYNYIEEKLNTLSVRINQKGKLNILDLHLHSENFYRDLFNLMYNLNLDNLNKIKHNVEAIDLLDTSNKLILQVSSTNTKAKINSTLKKDSLKNYSGYTFKFISISKDASELRRDKFDIPKGITFNPAEDIYDIFSILEEIQSSEIDKLKTIYEFIKKELGSDVDIVKLDSNLSKIVDILSKENLDVEVKNINVRDFDIERKIEFNDIQNTKSIISDYSLHYTRLDNIYSEFDKQGVNKSSSVHHHIKKIYISLCTGLDEKKSDWIFLEIIKIVKALITNSANFIPIADEELDLCVNIIVVDSFIRCKIFKNPKDYKYVTS